MSTATAFDLLNCPKGENLVDQILVLLDTDRSNGILGLQDLAGIDRS